MFKGNKRRRLFKKGQSVLLIVAATPVLVGAMSLVFDVGDLYFNHIEMQTATDSAVLAGGEYLPSYPSQAESVAAQYATLNGIKQSEIISVQVSSDDREVILTARRYVPCLFCAVFGVSTANAQTTSTSAPSGSGVSATSTSGIVPIHSARGVVPIGIDYNTQLTFGQQVQLKEGQVGAGNWGPLALGGDTGASAYSNNIEYGYDGVVAAGDWILTEPGSDVGPTAQAVNARISTAQNSYPDGTFQQHDLGDPRVMVVPLVDWAGINGRSQVPVKGFAVLWMVSVNGSGTITCYFIQQSIPNAVPDASASNTGVTTPVLLK